MADQHTQSHSDKKAATTAPSAEGKHDSPLNQPLTPPADKGEKNPFAAPARPQEAEPLADDIQLHSKRAGAESAAPIAAGSGAPVEETIERAPSGAGTTPTLADFHKEMKWERHGYRPVAFFNTVEDARASKYDLSKTEAYVDVRKHAFTADELAAVPDSAKHSNYYIGFAKELLERAFTKQFWTSFDGIGKVFSAGLISKEVSEIRLEAAEWLLSKRAASPAADAVTPDKEGGREPSPSEAPQTPPEKKASREDKAGEKEKPAKVLDFELLPPEEMSVTHTPSPRKAWGPPGQVITVEDLNEARGKDSPPTAGTDAATAKPTESAVQEAAEPKSGEQASSPTQASGAGVITVDDLDPARGKDLPPTAGTDAATVKPTESGAQEAAGPKSGEQASSPTQASGAGVITIEDLNQAPGKDSQPTAATEPTTVTPTGPVVEEAKLSTADRASKLNEKLDIAALQEIGARVQAKLEALRASIVPETITVRTDDPKGAQTVRQLQRYSEGFNAGFAQQTGKVKDAFDIISNLGLDQPQQAGVFKKKQENALGRIDSLSFDQEDLASMAKGIKVPRGNKLPDSMKEAMANGSEILKGIQSDLDEARRLLETARRGAPASDDRTDPVKTGSVISMPRLGRELSVDPRKLEMMGHAMVDANISDKDLNGWYKMVMSEFVKSYVGTFANVRKEIYASRVDGSTMNELQKEKFKYLADELGAEVKVSDLVQLDYSKFSLPNAEDLDARFRRVMDGSAFQRALNTMKGDFAAALKKEIEKVPGAENTDTTYVAFKRQKFEKSGVTDFLRS